MSETMLALLGFAIIIMIIVLLLKDVTVSAVALIGVSAVIVLILVLTGASMVKEMGGFIKAGVQGMHSTMALFIFSVLFSGIMTDMGMFDRVINALVRRMGHNVVRVTLMTRIVATIGHLDGGGASTFLITIPAVLPMYKCLEMRLTTLLLICATATGVMNSLPWGGPTMCTASVLEIGSNVLWMKLVSMQIVDIGIVLSIVVFWGFVKKERGADIDSGLAVDDYGISGVTEEAGDHSDLVKPGMSWFNICLILFIIVCLIWPSVPSYHTLMLGYVIALLVNYPGARLQNKITKSHVGPALMTASTVLATGVFLGVLGDSEVTNRMTNVPAFFISQSAGRFLPFIIGVLSMPPTLMFCTDSHFYGLLPMLTEAGNKFGVNLVHIGITMVVCRNYATSISLVAPVTFLGMGLAGVRIKDHIRTSFFWIWGVSLVCMVAGLLLGVLSAS